MARLGEGAAAIDPAIGVRNVARQAALALVEQLEHSDPRALSFHAMKRRPAIPLRCRGG
jgi:hypothetical protein